MIDTFHMSDVGTYVAQRPEGTAEQHKGLKPPPAYETGTILTIRMRGHSRSPIPGQDYFAPAVVLEQFMPDGEISCLVWDSSAGTHYNASYPVRDIGVRGEGNTREMYELQSNIGDVLFSPQQMRNVIEGHNRLTDFVIDKLREIQFSCGATDARIVDLKYRLDALEQFKAQFDVNKPVQEAAPVATSTIGTVAGAAAVAATKDDSQKPKASR